MAGHWIVGLDTRAGRAADVIAKVGLGVTLDRMLGRDAQALVRVPASVTYDQLKSALARTGALRYVEPDLLGGVQSTFPNDTRFGELWELNNTGQTGGTADADIDAPEAWDITQGSPCTVIGVIDTGVDYTHPDLAGNMWINAAEAAGTTGVDDDGNGYPDDVYGYDFVNDDPDPMDDYGHGTHVAGIIAARGNNGLGVTGVNWQAKIMALKFIDSSGYGPLSAAIKANNYATMMRGRGANIRVTNNSWRVYSDGPGINWSDLYGLYDSIAANRDAGILYVAAAGNDGNNNDNDPDYPASFDLDNIVSVAATDNTDSRAAFSNYGATSVDLGAPGVSILSTVPLNHDYAMLNGTSMASPHVAGVAALAFSVKPEATYAQMKAALLNGTDAVTSLNGVTVSGGRLNALRTVQLMNPAAVTVNGDESGVATSDTIVARRSPGNFNTLEVLVNGQRQSPVLQTDSRRHVHRAERLRWQ